MPITTGFSIISNLPLQLSVNIIVFALFLTILQMYALSLLHNEQGVEERDARPNEYSSGRASKT